MALDTGEELIAAALGETSALPRSAIEIEPFIVPYDQLARRDGWVVWLGHPPVPPGLPLLPIPDHLLWDEPLTALAATTALAADYAARRGARSVTELHAVLQRESPIAVIIPGTISVDLQSALAEVRSLGVAVIDGPIEQVDDLLSLAPFKLRREAHAKLTSHPHDPALSFQQVIADDSIGRDARSTFILHDQGERDGVEIDGEFDRRIGIEIGVRRESDAATTIAELEQAAARMPAFLHGVASRFANGALEIGWRVDAQPSAAEIGAVFHIWLKALFNLDLVDVRIIFAPDDEDSDALAGLNARADALRRERG